MYSCGSELEASIQELFECDLKSGTDFMTDLANTPLLAEDGFDEFAFLDGTGERLLDPYGLSLGLGSIAAAAFTPGNKNPFAALDSNGNGGNHGHHRSQGGGAKGASAGGGHNESWKMQSNLMNGLNFEDNFGILVRNKISIHMYIYLLRALENVIFIFVLGSAVNMCLVARC